MIHKFLSAAALFAISFNAMSANSPYWVNSSGEYVRSSTGGCVRTIFWTPENAVAECEGGAAAKPRYRNLSLASSATFELSGSTLSADGKSAVAALLADFNQNEIESIVVEGYTDNTGDASFNQQLSEKRAQAVKDELIANGVDENIIKAVGHGEAMPIADNDTREGRMKNRRVEIRVDVRDQEF